MQAGILESMRHDFARSALRLLSVVAGVVVLGGVTTLGQQPAASPTPATLPTGRELAAKHVKAAGGEAAFKAVKSIHAKGTFEMVAQGMSGPLDIMGARPDKMLLRVDLPSVGHVESGFDGKNGWNIDPAAGPLLLKGRALTEISEDAWFDAALHSPDRVKEMTTIAKTEWDNRPAYQVKVVFASGTEQTEYFDAETGFEIGFESERDTPMGVLPMKTILRAYQKFGGLMQPTVEVQSTMGISQMFKITSYEYNTVPADAFDPPPQIKALIK
jgi:hypothetical protein